MTTPKLKNISAVEEVTYGIYVWELPTGEVLGDETGILNVFCLNKNDFRAIKALGDAARHYGFPEGKPVWWSGHRPVTDEEYEQQRQRAAQGLIADPLDYAAIAEAEEEQWKNSQ